MTLADGPGKEPAPAGIEPWPEPHIVGSVPDARDDYLDKAPYEQAVGDAYEFARCALEAVLLEGKMPRQSRLGNFMYEGLAADNALPAIEEFSDDIMDLLPWYKRMQEAGMAPEAVFVPRHFTISDWSALQGNHPLPYNLVERNGWSIINNRYLLPIEWEPPAELAELGLEEDRSTWGIQDNWLAGNPIRLGPRGDGEDEAPPYRLGSYDPLEGLGEAGPPEDRAWGLVLVNGKNAPATLGVSSDGSKGRSQVREMRRFFGLSESLTDEQAVALLSPGRQTYNALQWRRLASAIIPVDIITTTILNDNLSQEVSCYATWNDDPPGVFLGRWAASETFDTLGLRPTVRSTDLELLAL